MKNIFALSIFLLLSFLSYSQYTISGRVLDEDNEGAVGANVVVQGTTIGVVTDLDGNFTLNIPKGKNQIVISYVGYNTQIHTVRPNAIVNAKLSGYYNYNRRRTHYWISTEKRDKTKKLMEKRKQRVLKKQKRKAEKNES